MILIDPLYRGGGTARILSVDAIASKGFGDRFKLIEKSIAADPQRTGMIYKEAANIYTAQAI
jgi:hypothetical protein